jgi:2-(1,2-epoxy-1,2-dihydrophenyl)acetyl-CoA isomerase
MPDETVLFDVADGVATITLNRPHVRNAFDVPTLQALYKHSVQAAEDRGVRAIALTGAGGHFSAGGDVKAMAGALMAGQEQAGFLFRELTIYFHGAVTTLARAQKPFLTAIDGTAAGGGFSLALSGDVSVASDRAQFSYSYTNIGLAPDGSSSYSLPRLVGLKRAMWLAYRNPKLSAADALALGLVNEVYPAAEFEARWRALAHELAAGPTLALAASKRLLRGSIGNSLEAQLEDERDAITACSQTADFLEGAMAFAEKRKATYRGA